MEKPKPKPTIEFLTRDGCVNTPKMRVALEKVMQGAEFVVVDIGALPRSDYRRGYGTPTVLVEGRDLFGMPKPNPSAEPT
jgi:hypothetical protein